MSIQYLTVPGLAGSGPAHWQSIWEMHHPETFQRVEQGNWDWPDKTSWVARLEETIQQQQGPVVLIAHSLGCITVVHWSDKCYSEKVAGALLVAPADAELSKRLSFVEGFSPIPVAKLPFPSVVIASTNDRYMSIKRAAHFAGCWDSEFINIGNKGHINAVSGLGDWDEGKQYLNRLSTSVFSGKSFH